MAKLRTGDQIQVGIVGYEVLSDETKQRHVIVRSRVSGKVKIVRIDTEWRYAS